MAVLLSDPDLLQKIARVETAFFATIGGIGAAQQQALADGLQQQIVQGDAEGGNPAERMKATFESLDPAHPDAALTGMEYLGKHGVQRGLVYGEGGWNRYSVRRHADGTQEVAFLRGPSRAEACTAEARNQGFTIV